MVSTLPSWSRWLVAATISLHAAEATAHEEIGFGGHVAYGLGGALADHAMGAGLRQNLDASFLIGSFDVQHSSIGMWSSRSGWMVGPMIATGFSEYPTYLGAEAGLGADSGLVGGAGLLGLLARVHPAAGGGATVRFAADLVLVQLGIRAVAVFVGSPEFQLTGTMGVGRF